MAGTSPAMTSWMGFLNHITTVSRLAARVMPV